MGSSQTDGSTTIPATATLFAIDRHERSPLEFQGALLVESDGYTNSNLQANEPHYRVRVYKETKRDFVLEIAIVANDKVVFQTADFAESPAAIDELLCLSHEDAMNGIAGYIRQHVTETKLLGERLEMDLDHQSVFVLQQLSKIAVREFPTPS